MVGRWVPAGPGRSFYFLHPDNPRVEAIGEFFARTRGKSLGIVTTSDVFDATPASFATHTSNRGAGTGICDQYLDEGVAVGGLKVLLGGGRK